MALFGTRRHSAFIIYYIKIRKNSVGNQFWEVKVSLSLSFIVKKNMTPEGFYCSSATTLINGRMLHPFYLTSLAYKFVSTFHFLSLAHEYGT